MFCDKALNQAHQGMEKWLDEVKKSTNDFQEGRRFSTISDLDIKGIYTPEDIKDLDFDARIGYPVFSNILYSTLTYANLG